MSDAATGSQVATAGHMLERARWAAHAYGTYSATDVARIVAAVAEAGHANARRYAEWAVRETGFGVVEHKQLKNEACSSGLLREYAADDFVTPRVNSRRKIVEVPRPAGVVLALTPSTNPVATVYFKVLLALMTRNAVVVSPHPMARECCADAATLLGQAAVAAGAPDGVVQVVREPTIPLVEALMADERVSVTVATGGTGVVRSAYSSGNPALGVGPGNVPVLVDATADVPNAARLIVESKAFDNSVLCTNESVLIAESAIAGRLTREMERAGAAILDRAAARQLTAYMFPSGTLSTAVVGKDASWIAEQAGLRVPAGTRLLVAPFDIAVPEEPLAHEKLSPVLGMLTVPSAARGIEAARAVVRIAGAGHSAAIHSTSPETVLRYAARVPVLRVSANVGNSTGSSGLDTNLATSMTIGTGFVGRSGLGENLQPQNLVDWTRVAYDASAGRMPDFSRVSPWQDRAGPVPAYPLASNDPRNDTGTGIARQPGASPGPRNGSRPSIPAVSGSGSQSDRDRFRAEIRQLVLAELSQLLKDLPMAELRSFIFLDRLQPQTMCYLGSWIKGSLPRAHMAAQIIEVAPGLDIEPLTDVAVKHAEVQAGVLVVERQFGYLEFHGETGAVKAAADAVLDHLGATAEDAVRPVILASKIISSIDHQHAFLINRNKSGSMVLAGESLYVLEMQPASYAIVATNEAEKAADIKVVDYRMIGATGRVYLSGREADVRQAADAATEALGSHA